MHVPKINAHTYLGIVKAPKKYLIKYMCMPNTFFLFMYFMAIARLSRKPSWLGCISCR